MRLALFFLFFPFALQAAETVTTPHVKVTLVVEKSSIAPGEKFGVGLDFEIKKGWHTYWKNPGDSGEPIHVRWAVSKGLVPGLLQYPTPHRIALPPLANFGFEGDNLLFSEVFADTTLKVGNEVRIRANAKWLVCEETCIPESGILETTIPVTGQAAESKDAGLFTEARVKAPKPLPPIAFHMSERGVDFQIPEEVEIPSGVTPFFFPDNPGLIENAGRQILLSNKVMVITRASTLDRLPAGITGLLVVGDKSYQIGSAIEPSSYSEFTDNEAASAFSFSSLLRYFVFAFLGGILLNLMPCVFPVLSVKILSFVKKSGEDSKKIRAHGWAYSLGVVVSFGVLAAILIFLRWSGTSLGWGFQLQSPGFVIFLVFILFLLALSLLGVFEIGGSLMGLGSHLAARGGLEGSFFTGVLATLVATPCTAPLMGPAIGFALSQPAAVSLTVFLALGAGMALPYLLLSHAPVLLKKLPKPGAWMETFGQAMAFPLLATVLWLLWVLNQQAPELMLRALLGLLFLSFAVWLGHRVKRARPLALLIGSAAFGWVLFSVPQTTPVSSAEEGGKETFSETNIAALRAQGRPVFIDFTAAWCLTCQVNKRLVLNSEDIRQAFAQKNVAFFEADWTNRDPKISKALEKFGRQGVPLYVYYPPQGEAKILPALLTKAIVLEALKNP